jgi:CHAT domain-containing protein/Tfp pilus assembly protein PilF
MSSGTISVIRRFTFAAALFASVTGWPAAAPSEAEIGALLVAGQTAEAEASAREAAARLEGTPGPALAEALDALVELLRAGGHAAEPETCRLAERAVARRRVDGSSPSELAASLTRLGEVLTAARELDGAASALIEAEELVRASAGDGREHALVLNRLAAVRHARGELAESIRLYRDALAKLERDGAKGDPELATCLKGMGGATHETRDFQSARRIYQDLVDEQISTTGEGSAAVGVALRYLASTFTAMGDLETSERLLRQSLSILEAQLGPSDLEVAYAVNSIAIDVRKRGDYLEARRMLERALAILELRLGPEHRYVAGVLNNLGNTYAALRDLPAARQAYERALTIREHSAVPAPLEVAQSLSNLGALVLDEGDVERAVALLERALAIREESLGSNARPVGLTLVNLGDALLEAGSLQRSREALERAAAILEQQPDGVHSSLAARINLGLVLLQQGSLDEAASTFDRARAQLEATMGHGHPQVGQLMYCQARVAAYRGNLDSALGLALESVRVDGEHLRLTAAGLSQRQAILYATEQQQALDLALTIAAEGPIEDPTLVAATWDALIRSRGAVLEEMATRRRRLLESRGDSSFHVEALQAAAYRLSHLLVEGEGPATAAELRAAREELDRAERALGEASPPFLRDQARAVLGLDEVSASLPPGSALVAYARFDKQFTQDPERRQDPSEPWYLALVRSPTGRLDVVPLADGATVDRWAREWRSAAGRPAGSEQAAHAAGNRLRELIWDPVAERVAGAEMIFVVPDGELGLLNFAALPMGSESFLIESGPLLAMVGQERDLVPDPVEVPASACLLALGAPDFDATPDRLPASAHSSPVGSVSAPSRSAAEDLSGARFTPLPGTAAETAAVVELWRRTSPTAAALWLAGDEASEAALKVLAPDFRVLHLATHGFSLDGDTSSRAPSGRGVGALVPAGDAPNRPAASEAGPLAGLALAGANHRDGGLGEDCILTAEEIAVLDLSGVEWAVLSACESGVGEASRGEGVFGLRRAFRVAGARTVIMSLWSVDDEAAREWMVALYRARLVDGLSTAEAVRRASLDVLAARRLRGLSVHPASWAAFVATGDWR